MSAPVRVLYLASTGRSGTTLVGNILGHLPGAFFVGELCYLGEWGLLGGHTCGCGSRLDRCRVWQPVLEKAFPGATLSQVGRELTEHHRRIARLRFAPMLCTSRGRRSVEGSVAAFGEMVGSLLRAVVEVTGTRVIIDSSKPMIFAWVLAAVPDIELRIVHVVRDPRAMAFSLTRVKPPDIIPTRRPAASAMVWAGWNRAASELARAATETPLVVRYEDLVAAPEAVVRRLAEDLDLDPQALPFTGPRTVVLGGNHTVAGNSDRHVTGRVEVHSDDGWVTGLRRRDRIAVSLITSPIRPRYGYSWSGR